jgi:MFS transporter, FHS family, glucose/mannose:H+ symporter
VSFAASSASASESVASTGRALAGFLLSGFLLALLGAILPAWGYHRDPPDFIAVGNYFLSIAAGLTAALPMAWRILERRGLRFLLVFACILASSSLLYLALVSPPLSAWWRAAGLLILGMSAGLLNVALFHALSRGYTSDAARTVIQGGIWYGLGCLAATLLVEGAFYAPVSIILVLMALAPAIFAAIYARTPYGLPPVTAPPTVREALRDFRSFGAILFALLLFFQFGNEWSLAGWLPLFLCRRVGMSPQQALFTLALYWFFLMAGRFTAVAILRRVRHGRLLFGSALAALFGLTVLYYTNNGFGAITGVFFLGAGYASIYPLVAEAIGRRFPYYHPGFCNGIFSLALLGGLMAPATLGYAAAAASNVGIVVGIPLLGTFLVVALLLLIWLESKVTGR